MSMTHIVGTGFETDNSRFRTRLKTRDGEEWYSDVPILRMLKRIN